MNYFIQKTLQLKDLNITINTEKVDEVIIKGQLSLFTTGNYRIHQRLARVVEFLILSFK